MGRRNRQKGAEWDREVRDILKEFYPAAKRGKQTRGALVDNEADVVGTGFWVECKTGSNIAWNQAVTQSSAEAGEKPWLVFAKCERLTGKTSPRVVMMSVDTLQALLRGQKPPAPHAPTTRDDDDSDSDNPEEEDLRALDQALEDHLTGKDHGTLVPYRDPEEEEDPLLSIPGLFDLVHDAFSQERDPVRRQVIEARLLDLCRTCKVFRENEARLNRARGNEARFQQAREEQLARLRREGRIP